MSQQAMSIVAVVLLIIIVLDAFFDDATHE